EADGNIIAPIITVQTARKTPRPPRVNSVRIISTSTAPRPAESIDALMLMAWCSISAQAAPVSTIRETGIVSGARPIADGTYQTSWMDVPPYADDPAFQTLRRSFQPDDLMPELTAAGVHCTVTIEAADYLAENEALLANSHTYDWIAGVVGWAPLAHPSEVERTLDVRAGQPA